ncbi:MAG: DUF1330 domain-containing protein [Desulfobacteraceae bacterium]|nr:MAG: DUF1330 domain-containing protein [Desulfobacteraceae bacterium]
MPHINPTHQQIEALGQIPDNGPFVMVNLLKFTSEGGSEAYDQYSRQVIPILERIGARVIYYGKGVMTFIGDDAWDKILLVEYPSKASFVMMITDMEYQQAVHFRTKALSDSRLYITASLF